MNNKRQIIGITGKSGSGKNHFAEQLLKINPEFSHIDIDTIGHKVLEDLYVRHELFNIFGNQIFFDSEGRTWADFEKGHTKINRKALSELVFNNRDNYEKLVEITWAPMEKMIDFLMKDKSKSYIINWILLPKTKYFKMCDTTYLIKRPEHIRIADIMKRDGITEEQVKLRDSNSINYDEADFTYTIINGQGNLMRKAVYAGSFDPFSLGHLDIYNQAKELFGEIHILIATNPAKPKRYTDIQQMKQDIKAATGCNNVHIWSDYVADYCRINNIHHLIRGLRNTSDYLYEEEIAKINMELFPGLETIYFRANNEIISSSLIRDMHSRRKDVSKYIPKQISMKLSQN